MENPSSGGGVDCLSQPPVVGGDGDSSVNPMGLLEEVEELTQLPKNDSKSVSVPVTKLVKKHTLYANDRVVKLNQDGVFQFGFVAINRMSKETRIDWDDGKDEEVLDFVEDESGARAEVALGTKIGILDRRCIGFGSKVMDEDGIRIGQVREKRFLVSLVLEKDVNVVIKDVPCEELIRPGYSRKDDKIVVNNEWIGLVADTRAGIYFKMDKDGVLGYVPDDNYGFVFPRPGDKLKSMMIYHLWDTKWISAGQTWWWNFFKYLGNTSTILDTKIDCITLAWMGNIHRGSVVNEDEMSLPPNTLRRDAEVEEIRHLYGRNWKYIREYETWNYKLKKEDQIIDFHQWVVEMLKKMFFGPQEDFFDMNCEDVNVDHLELGLEADKPLAVKISAYRSVVDVEWDDGSVEKGISSYKVQPYQYEGTTSIAEFFAGDVVFDLNAGHYSEKYGFIIRVFRDTAIVAWVTPDPDGHLPRLSPLMEVELTEISPHLSYLYLKSLHQLPVVVSKIKNAKGERISVDGVRLGVAVGINIAEAKIIVKCPDQVERLVWAHDFEHFEGDVAHDSTKNTWIPWYNVDENWRPILDYCSADNYTRDRSVPSLLSATVGDPLEKRADENSNEGVYKYFQSFFY